MKSVFSVGCILGMVVSTAAHAQSTPETSPVAAPALPHVAAPKAAASKNVPTAGAAVAQRPTMGLKLTMTQPKSSPMTQGPLPTSRYQNTHGTEKAQQYYAGAWGVDRLKASSTNSGNLIKFSYRVLRPKQAKALGDHENTPELVGIRSNAVLHIPTMEKIGQLRQMSAAEVDKEYWMVFSNKGNLVRRGDEVSVIIGKFRADGLIVE